MHYNWPYDIFAHAVDHDSLIPTSVMSMVMTLPSKMLRGYFMWKIWNRKKHILCMLCLDQHQSFMIGLLSSCDPLTHEYQYCWRIQSAYIMDGTCRIKFQPSLARTNHYPGLKTAKLSSAALEKVSVNKLKTFFRPPNLLQILKPPILSLL